MAWVWLILGGLFEVGFTTSLRFVDGFRNIPWTLAFLVSVAISMALLEYAARTIPMGTAYAVWGGDRRDRHGAGRHGLVRRAGDDAPDAAHPRHRRLHRRPQADRMSIDEGLYAWVAGGAGAARAGVDAQDDGRRRRSISTA